MSSNEISFAAAPEEQFLDQQPSFVAISDRLAKKLEDLKGNPVRRTLAETATLRLEAEAALGAEIVDERLQGDLRGLLRWKANNQSYWKFRLGLKISELNGSTDAINEQHEGIEERLQARQWRPHGLNSVVSPAGTVMTKRQARLLGWTDGSTS